ncbi:hypothetical protein O181_111351, partial [Austropuccinia psidii MF-1]|nr:hypothetical protein [Austropuccinia psidii MF-1]
MDDLSIANINDQLTILKNHVLEIVDNTNTFATNLARRDSERQKLKEVIIAHYTEEKEESDQASAVSEDTPVEDYSNESITAFFEFTEGHTHLPQYSEDCYNLINEQDTRM